MKKRIKRERKQAKKEGKDISAQRESLTVLPKSIYCFYLSDVKTVTRTAIIRSPTFASTSYQMVIW